MVRSTSPVMKAGRGGGTSIVHTCFNCRQLGHKSSDCTNPKLELNSGKGGRGDHGRSKGGIGKGGGRKGAGGADDQRALNAQLARAVDRAEINQLVLQHCAEFNSVNCATALHRLAKCAPSSSSSLAATDAHWKKSWSAAAKASAAKATSSSEDAAVEDLLCRRCVTLLEEGSEVTARSLTSIAWATGKLKLAHAPLCAAFSAQAAIQVARGGLDAFGIANVAWALATLHMTGQPGDGDSAGPVERRDASSSAVPQPASATPSSLLDTLAEAAISNGTIDEFKPQELCNLLWAFATLRRPHAALFDAAARSASCRMETFSAQGLSQTVWAFAKLELASPRLFQAAAEAALPRLGTYDAQSVATLAWAFGAAGIQHAILVAGLSKVVLARSTDFDATSCARLFWALSRFNEGVDPAALAKLSSRLTRATDEEMQSKQLLYALGALAKLKSGGLEAGNEGGRHGGGGGGVEGGGASLATFLCEAASKAAPTLSASKLGITAWALSRPAVHAQLPVRARVAWKAALREATLRVAADLSWRCVSHIELALRTLEASEGEGDGRSCKGMPLVEILDGNLDPVVAALTKAARCSMDFCHEKSIARNEAPVNLLVLTLDLLLEHSDLGAARARGASRTGQVLLAGFDECGPTTRLDEALRTAGLAPVHWRRFASSGHDTDTCASPWPAAPSGGAAEESYVACIVRWSWYAAGDAASMLVHACASVTCAGTPLWLCGNDAEGVEAAGALLEQAYGEASRLVSEGGCTLYSSCRGPAGATAASSARGSLEGWVTHSSLLLPQLGWLPLGDAHSGALLGKKRKREADSAAETMELPWCTYPGLFAGGGLDVMTTALLQTLPKPPAGACVLDACCGSGAIAAALRHAHDGGALRVHLLDADAVAMHAAKLNVPDAARHWHGAIWPQIARAFSVGKPKRYHWIVSNPPVHRGQPDDFRVVAELIRGSRKRLKRCGVLWLVAQEHVPMGRLLALHGRFASVEANSVPPDGRFVVWRASGRRERNQ